MPELNTVDEIYEHVAGALAATVDEPWSEIRLHAEIWTTSIGFTGEYTRQPPDQGEADLDVGKLGYSVAKAFMSLQKIMASSAHGPWNRATFKLAPDGQFSVNFTYDDALVQRLKQSAAQARLRSNPE
jgi:Protein of unknown function, DUF600